MRTRDKIQNGKIEQEKTEGTETGIGEPRIYTDARRDLIYKETRKRGGQERKVVGNKNQIEASPEQSGTKRAADLTQERGVLKLVVGDRNEEVLPSDLIASREWEVALIFDNLRNGVEQKLEYWSGGVLGLEVRRGQNPSAGRQLQRPGRLRSPKGGKRR